MRARAMRSHAT
ncbi:unnamed protein product, partial [Didymodactylos carnosus]